MNARSAGEQPVGGSAGHALSDAARFWEPRRIAYNLILAAVALTWVGATWPHFRDAATLSSILPLAVLALLANLAYCAAYLVDIAIRRLAPLDLHRPRSAVMLLGTLLALGLEWYWIADEIYPSVR